MIIKAENSISRDWGVFVLISKNKLSSQFIAGGFYDMVL